MDYLDSYLYLQQYLNDRKKVDEYQTVFDDLLWDANYKKDSVQQKMRKLNGKVQLNSFPFRPFYL